MRLTDIEKQLDDDNKIVRYRQSSEAQLRQAQQESRLDEHFHKRGKLLCDKMPA